MVGTKRKFELDSPYMKGDDVLYLQKSLNKWDSTLKLDEDGVLGPKTDAAHQKYLAAQSPAAIKVGEATYMKKV